MSNVSFGSMGEKIALDYLIGKGYTILHTNWRWGHKELDIVAKIGSTMVVVEVKTRGSSHWQEPKDAVVKKKQKNIISAADAYVSKYNHCGDVQFDIISIVWQHEGYSIEHIEDAFYPTL